MATQAHKGAVLYVLPKLQLQWALSHVKQEAGSIIQVQSHALCRVVCGS